MQIIIGGDCNIDPSECQSDFEDLLIKEEVIISSENHPPGRCAASRFPRDHATGFYADILRLNLKVSRQLPSLLHREGDAPAPLTIALWECS